MPAKSEFTEVVLQLQAEIRAARKEALMANPIPLMTERLNPRDARNRLTKMSPDEKQAYIRDNGLDATLQLLRGGK